MLIYPEYRIMIGDKVHSEYSEKEYTASPGKAYQYAMLDWKALAPIGARFQMRTVKVDASDWETLNADIGA